MEPPPRALPELELSEPSRVQVHEANSRPKVATFAREGDPLAALSLAVLTEGGSLGAAALASIVERRLEERGSTLIGTRADRDGYRVEALVSDENEATALLAALRDALLTRLSADSPELSGLVERMAELRASRGDGVTACTGRLDIDEGEELPDPASKEGLEYLEELRRASHVGGRISVGVIGPRALGERVAETIAASPAWPQGPRPREGWPERDSIEVAPSARKARATVALRVGDAHLATRAAERVSEPESALALRLASLPSNFRVTEVVATARPRGGCISATIEAKQPADDPRAWAQAAATVRKELETELGESSYGPAGDPWQAVVEASDPRRAASLLAWWSIAGERSADEPIRAFIRAELPAKSRGKAEPSQLDERFAALLAEAEPVREARIFEPLVRVERGQDRLWLLLASPCGVHDESEEEAGLTALSVLSAVMAEEGPRDGVTIEPWLSAEGIGVLAHASPRKGESPRAHARRVAEEVARALLLSTRSKAGFFKARSMLLARLADESDDEGVAFEAASWALAPSYPSWLSPLGTWDAVSRMGPEAAALRMRALLSSPLRLSVLANAGVMQGEVAARTLERFLVQPDERDRQRICLAPSRKEPHAGLIRIETEEKTNARAVLALPIPLSTSPDRESAALLASALEGPEGLLAQSLHSLDSVGAKARLLGGPLASALLIDLRAPDEALEPAIAKLRSLLLGLADGSMTQEAFERAQRKRSAAALEASLDPRRRSVELWLSREVSSPPTFEGFQGFLKETLREDRAVLVVARPKASSD